MIKGPQIAEILREGFHYITAITKPQIESLLKAGVFQMELFDQPLAEVCEPGARYVLRRNPRRAEEMQATRQSKLDLTVEEGIKQLATLCVTEIISDGKVRCGSVPQPRPDVAELIALSGIPMPAVIRCRGVKVATKKKLPPRRVKRS